MPNIIVCSGDVVLAPPQPTGPTQAAYYVNDVYQTVPMPVCLTGWEIVPYVEPTDSTAIYAQLVALNEFDPVQIAGIVTFCLAMFIVGFGVGMVINKLRRS
jgi:hypothetical protein